MQNRNRDTRGRPPDGDRWGKGVALATSVTRLPVLIDSMTCIELSSFDLCRHLSPPESIGTASTEITGARAVLHVAADLATEHGAILTSAGSLERMKKGKKPGDTFVPVLADSGEDHVRDFRGHLRIRARRPRGAGT